MDEFDFSDLPTIKAGNEQALKDAGIEVPPATIAASEVPPLLTEEQLQDIGKEVDLNQKYGQAPLETAAVSAASAATFSLSDRALKALDIYKQEELQELRKRNPEADVLGAVAGTVASVITPTGIAGTAVKAVAAPARAALGLGKITEKAAAKIVSNVIKETGTKGVAQSVIKKSIEKGAGGLAEGGAIGLGQLMREEALGEADINAENILSHVGTGALYGGVLGAAMPAAGAALVGTGVGAKGLFSKAFSKYASPRKAAEELTGFNTSKLMKLESTKAGKELLDELPKWYADEVKIAATDSADSILKKVNAVKASAGESIDAVLQQADEAARTRISAQSFSGSMRKQLLGDVADEIENEFYKPYKEMKSLSAQNRKVLNLISDIRKESISGQPLTGRFLIDFKRRLDIVAKSFYDRAPGAAPKVSELAAFKARDLMKKASQRYVDYIDPKLGAELVRANKNYHFAKTVETSLLKKAVKDPTLLSFKDALFGALGYGVGEQAGLGLLGAKKFLESDFRRKLVILSGIERANKVVSDKVKSSVAATLRGTARPSKIASLSLLLNSPLAINREDGAKDRAPSNKKEAFNNIQKNLSNLVINSDVLLDRSVKAGAPLSYAAPQTAAAVGEKAISAVNFLMSKVPKNPYEAVFPTGGEPEYEPSSMELAKFERYLQVVDNPLSVLDDIETGLLTKEHVEALKAVYPRLYMKIREEALEQMSEESAQKMSYAKKVQLSMLLDIPGDSSLLGKNIAALQTTFVPEEKEQGAQPLVKPTASGTQRLSLSTREATETQAFLNRRATGE